MFAGTRLAAACLALGALSCAPMPDLANGHIQGVVMVSTPVQGATVTAWRLDPDNGERLEQIAQVRSDMSSGEFAFHIGTTRGVIEVQAIGGSTVELAMGTGTTLDRELRAVLVDVEAGEIRDIALTPYSTIATALGDSRAQPGRSYIDAMSRAYELLGDHLGVEMGRTLPADMRGSVSLDARGRYGVALAALAGLAARIARESIASERGYNTLDLMQALMEDAAGDGARFDGVGPSGQIRTGACVPDPACTTCPTVCDLDGNTLRADLGAALVYEYITTAANTSGLQPGDVLPIVEAWRSNAEADLFGAAATEPITGEPPMVTVGTTSVSNESEDRIAFPEPDTSIPMHTASGNQIVLGPGQACETVYKHVTRLDDPQDNPIRWIFSVAGAGVVPGSGEYRVGLRDQAGVQWLTAWLPAVELGTVANGYQYEVILLRSNVPELGTEQGTYEIEFRGRDAFGQTSTAGRCWQHEILPPPLWYSAASVPPATVGRSLHSVSLDPGNNLAPLLNGVPLTEGKVIMEFEIRNGTKEPAYVTFGFDQAVTAYEKTWQEGNVYLFGISTPDPDCLVNGTCTSTLPLERLHSRTQGTIEQLASDVVIWDYTAGDYLQRCPDCDPGEYRIAPHLGTNAPRRYRVMLVVTDLSVLAPRLEQGDSETGPFEEFTLDLLLPLRLTGRQYQRVELCTAGITQCSESEMYRWYRALLAASLSTSWLAITGQSSANPGHLPLPGIEVQLDGFTWATTEPTIPPITP